MKIIENPGGGVLTCAEDGVAITEAGPEDAAEILEIQKAAYASEAEIYDDFTIPPMRQSLDEITMEFSNSLFLKAARGGSIFGSVRAFMEGGTCFIGRLIVRPEHQNRGIGTELMDEIERRFGKANRFELFTGHRSERNLRLYGKLGYKPFKTEVVHPGLEIVFLEKVNS